MTAFDNKDSEILVLRRRARHSDNDTLRLTHIDTESLGVPRTTPAMAEMERRMLDAVNDHRNEVRYECGGMDPGEFFRWFCRQHPEVFWLSNRIGIRTAPGQTYITLMYTWIAGECRRMQAQTDMELGRIVAGIPRGLRPHERLRRLYDWFCANIRYNHAHEGREANFNIIGPLINRIGVCSGISRAFMLACRRLRIPCGIVTGNTGLRQESTHCWNIVKLNGAAYHVDVTTGINAYESSSEVGYPLFCVPESRLRRIRYIELPAKQPESDEFSYRGLSMQYFTDRRGLLVWLNVNLRPGHALTVLDPGNEWRDKGTFAEALRYTAAQLMCGRAVRMWNIGDDVAYIIKTV